MVNAEDAILVTTDSKKESSKGNEKDKGTATEAQQEEMVYFVLTVSRE